ncbi:retrotransposon protein, putative, ty1-copia subclass [Tanacetum coccineum]
MFMGNGTASKIEGKRKVILKLTSGKDLYSLTCCMCQTSTKTNDTRLLINTKDEALNMFKTYKAEVENQLDKKIKIIRSDKGGEYESNDFAEFCSTFGTDIIKITGKRSKPDKHEHGNGKSTQEPGIIKLWSTKSQPWSNLGQPTR